jgi:threonine dehydrogenase-like Zn-dependent dehydrogenase
VEVLSPEEHDGVPAVITELTRGRGADAVIDAVGPEAHGSAGAELAQKAVSVLPDRIAGR